MTKLYHKKDIAEMVRTAKYLAKNDPKGFMRARNAVDVLKDWADMEAKTDQEGNKKDVKGLDKVAKEGEILQRVKEVV